MRSLAATAVVVVFAFTAAAAAGAAATDPGCQPAAMPAFADNSFTPFSDRRTQRVQPPTLGKSGEVLADLAAATGRVPFSVLTPTTPTRDRVLVVLRPAENQVTAYFASRAIDATDSVDTFLAAGGLLIAQQPAADGRDAKTVLSTVGARSTSIAVGPHDAAVVHADPDRNGLRSYNVYWTDGTRFNFVIAADAIAAVDAARSMYCSGVG
jgi:hypothetical protein